MKGPGSQLFQTPNPLTGLLTHLTNVLSTYQVPGTWQGTKIGPCPAGDCILVEADQQWNSRSRVWQIEIRVMEQKRRLWVVEWGDCFSVWLASEAPGSEVPVGIKLLHTVPEFLHHQVWGGGLRMCISDRFPTGVDAVGAGPRLWESAGTLTWACQPSAL